jgi:hypothetical protein
VFATSIIRAKIFHEKSVNFSQTTLRYNPEDSHIHTRRRENLKSHQSAAVFLVLEAGTLHCKL